MALTVVTFSPLFGLLIQNKTRKRYACTIRIPSHRSSNTKRTDGRTDRLFYSPLTPSPLSASPLSSLPLSPPAFFLKPTAFLARASNFWIGAGSGGTLMAPVSSPCWINPAIKPSIPPAIIRVSSSSSKMGCRTRSNFAGLMASICVRRVVSRPRAPSTYLCKPDDRCLGRLAIADPVTFPTVSGDARPLLKIPPRLAMLSSRLTCLPRTRDRAGVVVGSVRIEFQICSEVTILSAKNLENSAATSFCRFRNMPCTTKGPILVG
mmetsp:Transcript_6893/g.14628  ORF Transcript_6893/g.14628 Transcript_6893/m.14628 type:complete len:264 (+) Transcript_6893:443-1234(+)